ncbi:dynamin-1-like protein [Thrips palmi]|uniref:Dynamin-1-like protein n=1 Tax=Thrips palmi TaxID=161013 RepID=A0A6P8YR04_THRPL|nr:dynamin-1-like protein [Thrips palmi]
MADPIQQVFKIQQALAKIGKNLITLPRLAVLGSQSAGKSSVLESLVGHAILPRGGDMVTRCPLVLHLKKCDPTQAPWGEFVHHPGRRFTPEEIEREIQRKTQDLTSLENTVSHTEIFLTFNSPDVTNMSLIDLPGLVKNAKPGQPDNIAENIKDLVMKYIKDELCIILAISIANDDMVNSESLALAKIVDPDGSRTLAVLTKVDLMDPVSDLPDMLKGNVVHVRRGIVGVKNRSPTDMRENTTIAASREIERAWWDTNFPDLSSTNGVVFLSNKLHCMLLGHIKENLPDVKYVIKKELKKYSDLILEYGNELNHSEQKVYLEGTIPAFVRQFQDILSLRSLVGGASTNGVTGASKIYSILCTLAETFEKFNACDHYTLDQVLNVLDHVRKDEPSSISTVAFAHLFKPCLEDLRAPALECIDSIAAEIKLVCDKILDEALHDQFPVLSKRMSSIVLKLISQHAAEAKKMVNCSLDIEKKVTYSLLGTDSVAKMTESLNIDAPASKMPFSGSPSKKPERRSLNHAAVLGCTLTSYFKLVCERIHNTVTKVAYVLLWNESWIT